MNLTQCDLDLMKNFAWINQGLVFSHGKRQKTISPDKTNYCIAEFESEFPRNFAIYDLNHFIGVYNLVSTTGTPVIEFDEGVEYLTIKNDIVEQDVKFCQADLVISPPEKELNLPEPEIKIDLSQELLEYAKKSASVNGFDNIGFETEDGEIYLFTTNSNNSSSEKHKRKLNQSTTDTFSVYFSSSNYKMIPDDYLIEISVKGLAKFTAKNKDYEIFIVPEPNIKFNN